MRVAAKAFHFERAKPGIDRVAQRRRWLRRTLQIKQLARDGRPRIEEALRRGTRINFAMTTLPASAQFTEVTDTLGLVAWLFEDVLTARLEAEIDACADDRNALSDAEREQKMAALAVEMLAIERKECALIWLADAQGDAPIDMRPDCTPMAILGVRLITTPSQARGSTEGYRLLTGA